jgi:hypothetical protein
MWKSCAYQKVSLPVDQHFPLRDLNAAHKSSVGRKT